MSAEGPVISSPARRHLILEVLSPTADLRRFLLAPGASARVGRTAVSDFVIDGDDQLSGAHFLLEWDGVTASVCDLRSTTGTLLGGAKVAAASVRHGDWIRAGNTDFRVYYEGQSQLRDGGEERTSAPFLRAIQRHLEEAGEHLYAVLDAARSPRVLALLKESADEHQSLFDGMGGASLWRVAPYLVKLAPASSGLLGRLLAEGWGRSWGIYVMSSSPFGEVRRHFRRHLRALDPDDRPMYFRLYDPRVLRRFLPMCSERQTEELFAHVNRYVAEGKSAQEAHVFRLGAGAALKHQILTLEGEEPAAHLEPAAGLRVPTGEEAR